MTGLSPIDYRLMLPMVELTIFALGLLLIDLWIPREWKWLNAAGAFIGVLFSALCVWQIQAILPPRGQIGFYNSLLVDRFAIYFWYLFLALAALTILGSSRYLDLENEHRGEYYALLLISVVGMMSMAAGIDIVLMFVGLELTLIPAYLFAGFRRRHNQDQEKDGQTRDARAREAARKFVFHGLFSSAIFAYGLSLLYGFSGSTNLAHIVRALGAVNPRDPVVIIALLTTMTGLLSKIAAVPLHHWAPAASETAPTTISGYITLVVAAAWVLFLRIVLFGMLPLRAVYAPVLTVVAIATLTLATVAALMQTNTKRLLAYSAIVHTGYILLSFSVIGSERIASPAFFDALKAMLIYLPVLALMNLGAFLVLAALRQGDVLGNDLADLTGLFHRSPFVAVTMLIFLFSLAGIPPAAGYLGKYYIFRSLMECGHRSLAAAGVVFSLLGLLYYWKLAKPIFTRQPQPTLPLPVSFGMRAALAITALATLVIGAYPRPLITLVSWVLGIAQATHIAPK